MAAVSLLILLPACWGGRASDGGTPARGSLPRGAVFSPAPLRIVTNPADNWFDAACDLDPEIVRRIRRGYFPARSPDLMIVPREPNYFGGFNGWSHSGPWDYLQRVPLVLYGPGFIRSRGTISLGREATIGDLAATFAEVLNVTWPEDRPATPIREALVPRRKRPVKPRLILTVVWDGGGRNVLDAWPEAWPHLADLAERGTAVANAVVGSSPSVTPAIHTNLGTGTWPKRHGIVDIPLRVRGRIVGSFRPISPRYLLVPTVADMYDRTVGNRAKIGMLGYRPWHLGMMGHGAYLPGGDKDIAVIVGLNEDLVTNSDWYSMPAYLPGLPGLEEALQIVDRDDGELDSRWMGNRVFDDPRGRRDTPAWVLYQTKLIKELLGREGFGADGVTDMFFTNFKQIDEVGHRWNMLSNETREVVRYSDSALQELTQFLDRRVGRGKWVLAVTADHGQGPEFEAARAWPIRMGKFKDDVAAHFGLELEELFQTTRPVGFWLRKEVLDANGIGLDEVADFIIDYRLEDNVYPGEEIPAQYRNRLDEAVIAAAIPGENLGQVWRCLKRES